MTYFHPHEAEERDFAFGPRLWDADPEVCCAAFQLGACAHTEADNYLYDEDDMTDAELAEFRTAEIARIRRYEAAPAEDEPF